MKVLAIGAHFDDIELGCGGSLLKWINNGDEISIYIATKSGYADAYGTIIRSNETAREEGVASATILKANLFEGNFSTFEISSNEELHQSILNVLEKVKPDLVLCHWIGDTHHDHRNLATAFIHCSRNIGKILMYRSNWYLSEESFDPRFYVNIDSFIEKKIELVKLFASEFHRTSGTWERFIRTQASNYGLVAKCNYAEAFQIIKWVE